MFDEQIIVVLMIADVRGPQELVLIPTFIIIVKMLEKWIFNIDVKSFQIV